jgi:hypothetical protein
LLEPLYTIGETRARLYSPLRKGRDVELDALILN